MSYIVYFYYNGSDDPIYVGKTQKDPIKRHLQHRNEKWINEAQRIGIREYDKKNQMDMAERYYIDAFKPRYNTAFKTKDTFDRDSKFRVIDDTTESLYTIDEFEALYRPITAESTTQEVSEAFKLTPEEKKIRNFHKMMHRKHPDIIRIEEPDISNVSLMFKHNGLMLQLGNAYFSAGSDDSSKNLFTEPSKLTKRFLSAWISASKCGNEFVMFSVRLDNLDDYIWPSIHTYYITEDGGIHVSFNILGPGTISFDRRACSAMYVMPSIERLIEYMKTKDETLIDYHCGLKDDGLAEDR